ncbi:putative Zinc finger C-x8-C-x5-C-x3-H type (and similar)/CCCH-type zinc finger containing protein [Leishmania naiffi]|uniref:Zinc finger C-x8-C-x5-C-x3-H type (And similar)/CCCH-type zinc finger containing protein n=1 Tax=Leishmania naiffi TaxID=5678 RepID=A0AAW3C8M4_9TRYP
MIPQRQKPGSQGKRYWQKKKSLYDEYLADSGDSEEVGADEEQGETFECEQYYVNMDVNILIQQTVQNIVQSVCLEDPDGFATFGDHELICFAAAVKHNSSIMSLQIRYLDVSDVSLIPLCRALHEHPSIRALDLSGTRGGEGTSKALRQLVCTNSKIIFMRLEDTMVNPKDANVIEKATRYNSMACTDPNNNPFHLGLLRRISAMDEKEHKFHEQLHTRPWLLGNGSSSPKRFKKTVLSTAASSHIGGEICAQFIQGRCPYGSRCKYIHPERTVALKNVVASSLYNRSEQYGEGDLVSTVLSTTAGSRQRLQSRLRPPAFMLKKVEQCERQEDTHEMSMVSPPVVDASFAQPLVHSWWMMSVTVVCCCVIIVTVL